MRKEDEELDFLLHNMKESDFLTQAVNISEWICQNGALCEEPRIFIASTIKKNFRSN